MTPEETTFERSWRRLGLTEVWGLPLLGFTIIVVALLSFAFDAVRLNNYSLAWFPINSIAFLGGVAVVVISWQINQKIKLPTEYRPIYNIVTASTAMGIKNMATLYLCGYFGVADSGAYWFRFLGGAAIGVGLLLIYSNLVGARIEYRQINEELLDKERSLIGFRENISTIFAEEEAELREMTSSALLPRFAELQEQIENYLEAKKVSESLKLLLTNEVKPISDSLANEAKTLTKSLPVIAHSLQPEADIRINAGESIKPIASTLMTFMSWLALTTICLPKATVTDVLIASVIYGLILAVFRVLAKAFTQVRGNAILLLSWLPGFLAGLPAYFLFFQIPHTQVEGTLIPTTLVISSLVSLALGQAYVLEVGRELAAKKLQKVLASFEKENILFQQRLWVAQHVWYTLLHGTVQAALTAASIRASSKDKLSTEDRKAIVRDLERASQALRNPGQTKISLQDSIEALKSTWEGILAITLNCPAEIASRIESSHESSTVVNEILKEAVSNAVRHAGASSITVDLELDANDNLQLKVLNDGSAPTDNSVPGVGSRIFDSLCISRTLRRNPVDSLTEFVAIIPLA